MNNRLPSNALQWLKQLKLYALITVLLSIFLLLFFVFMSFDFAKKWGNSDEPAQLIRSMTESLQTLSYEGTYVVLSGTAVDTLKTKQVNNGTETIAQVKSLNGEAREVFRNSERVTCIWPNSQSVFAMKSQDRPPGAGHDVTLNSNYRYKRFPDDRIAGRETFVVEIVANDTDRYSYRMWIDQETKMLLKSMLFDHSGNPVEQMMFTDIRFGHDITIDNLSNKLEYLEFETVTYAAPSSVPNATDNKVRFDILPKGFRKVSEMSHTVPNVTGIVRHIFLTDGIATISVYVQFDYNSLDETHFGLSKLGGMAAYEQMTDTAFTTVMGDVPAHTIYAVAKAVRINEP